MAEVEYSATTRLPAETVWDFVQEMDHWAAFVTGYQSHEKQGASDSRWTLKGDLGVMARTLTFQVRVTEWDGPRRVRFEMQGLNESMTGSGCFELSSAGEEATPAPAPGPLRRLLDALARFFYRWIHGRVERPALAATAAQGADATRLRFRLRIDPGGPMAPMVDAMIAPLLAPAAESLAERILAALEEREGKEADESRPTRSEAESAEPSEGRSPSASE
jgi:carbon monoxide dehydrogenase subunit G